MPDMKITKLKAGIVLLLLAIIAILAFIHCRHKLIKYYDRERVLKQKKWLPKSG
jgi:hypothetical protein